MSLGGSMANSATSFAPRDARFSESLLAPLNVSAQGESLDVFLAQYSKLQQALLNAHESEQKLVAKCKSLSKQIRLDAQKLNSLLNLHESDKKRRLALKQEISNAQQQKDELAKVLHGLRGQVKTAQREMDELAERLSAGPSAQPEGRVGEEAAAVARLEAEVRSLAEHCARDRQDLTKVRQHNMTLAQQLADVDATCKKSQAAVDALDGKLQSAALLVTEETQRRKELERKLLELKTEKIRLEHAVQARKGLADAAAKAHDSAAERLGQTHAVLEAQKTDVARLRDVILTTEKGVTVAHEEYSRADGAREAVAHSVLAARTECAKSQSSAEEARKKLDEMAAAVDVYTGQASEAERTKGFWEREMAALKDQIEGREGKRTALRAIEKEKENYVRAREVLSQAHTASVDKTRLNDAAIRAAKSVLSNAQNELNGYLVSIRTLTRVSEALRQDRASHEEALLKRRMQRARADEELADRQLKVAQLQQQLVENESKLHSQQSLIERSIAERTHLQKRVMEKRNEIKLCRAQAVQLAALIKRLQDEVRDKQQQYLLQHVECKEVRHAIMALEGRNRGADSQITAKKGVVGEQEQQVRNLGAIVAAADEELRVQLKQYNSIVGEHAVLSQQLVRRNAEVAQLYEHLKLQNSVLDKSRAFYDGKAEAVRALAQTRDDLQSALDEVQGDNGKFSELQQAVSELQQALVDEQLKVRALQDEARRPMNVHRWRRLKATNAESYRMLKHIRRLQTLIIAKGAEVETKDRALAEKEKLYVELRKVLARQPSSEAAEQLRLYAETLQDKRGKYSAMKRELQVFQDKVYESKGDLQRLQQDLQGVKLDYYARRRKEASLQHNGGGDGGAGGSGGGGFGATAPAGADAWGEASTGADAYGGHYDTQRGYGPDQDAADLASAPTMGAAGLQAPSAATASFLD